MAVAMSSGRTVLYLAGGGLLVAWIAAANMPSHDADRASDRAAAPPAVPTATIADDVQAQAARLQARMAQAPAPEDHPRNPFTFGATPRHARAAQPVAAATLAEPVPAFEPPPPPALMLMGIAEETVPGGVRRTAVLGLGEPQGDDAILMVVEGDRVGDRYTVTKIGADAIELEDLVTKAYRRLALR
jgi:hypothetical protein